MLAVAKQIGQQLDLGSIRHAKQRGIIGVERNVLDAPIAGVGQYRVDGRHNLRSSDRGALSALDAQPDNDNAHARSPYSPVRPQAAFRSPLSEIYLRTATRS